jgi:hypothetical protein
MRTWLSVVVVAACSSPHPKTPAAEADPPTCSGQTPDTRSTSKTPREGTMTLQLSPSFLDQMQACTKPGAAPQPELVQAQSGTVTSKGDCAWATGVECHLHLGAEFVDSHGPRPSVGEIHCMFPTSTPNSPRVYVTHFTCKAGSSVPHGREVHAQQACGANLLPTLAATMDRCDPHCCDRGTLTDPPDARRDTGQLAVRPDFAVCTTTAELDCSMFAAMTGRAAYAPAFGAPIDNGI